MTTRRRMAFLLLVVAGLLWLNWRSADRAEVVAPVARAKPQALAPEQTGRDTAPALLPARLERPPLELAERDPFAPQAAKPLVAAKQTTPTPAAQAAPAVAPAPPPRAIAPPHNLRFAGRMTTPDGRELLYVTLGDSSLALSVGQTLANGYRVEAVNPRSVELSHPSTNSTARLDLPEPPRYEIR